ncbi:MAG: hypothetical protein CL583_01790 [Alteromonadaceae bacterium]|nr:hypothetical protein [Alteromonadaceae bacterium]|tara:strand:- start:1687 stop:2259 length:573 start_codon:yes stop_codon:yes gene_type:complete
MKLLLTAALTLPMTASAALIEWVGTGPQEYHWTDQAHPTATISILADENSIHRINITNTKTSLTYENPETSFFFSDHNQAWVESLFTRNHQPDFYAGDPSNQTPLNSMIRWTINQPETANPYDYLSGITSVGVSRQGPTENSYAPEFLFTPTEWTRTVIDDDVVTVPEPASAALLLLGLAGFAGMRRYAR